MNIANTVTVAELEDTAVLTGAHDLTLSATSDNSVITTAKAGGAATGGSGVGIGGAIATSVANNDTRADLGSGALQTVTGNLSATATHTGSTTTFADGSCRRLQRRDRHSPWPEHSQRQHPCHHRPVTSMPAATSPLPPTPPLPAQPAPKPVQPEPKKKATTPDDKGVDKKIGAERGLADKKASETGTKGTGGATDTPKPRPAAAASA